MSKQTESPWCRLCGEHKTAHGENLGKLIKRIDHKFTPEWIHREEVTVFSKPEEPPTDPTMEALKDHVSSGPQPEFPLDELVTADVKEPKIEFNYGLCKICEIPLTEEYEHVSFCGDCAEDTFTLIFSGDNDEGNLPN